MPASSGPPAMRGAILSWAIACSSIEWTSVRYLVSCSSKSVMHLRLPAIASISLRAVVGTRGEALMRSTLGAAACAAAVALVIPATSYADKTVTAETVWRFDASEYTIDQGEKLTFKNTDAVSPGPHNVTSNAKNGDKPLFASKTIKNGEEAAVDGAQQLKTGSYDFICTVHPFMQATLKVTDKGTPLPPPGSQQQQPEQQPQPQQSQQPADTRAPTVRASVVRTPLR